MRPRGRSASGRLPVVGSGCSLHLLRIASKAVCVPGQARACGLVTPGAGPSFGGRGRHGGFGSQGKQLNDHRPGDPLGAQVAASLARCHVMSYVEKMNALAGARDLLGVGLRASAEDLHAAWKRVAFETHPDRNNGSRQAFDRAKAAYALLVGDEPGTRPRPESGRRGSHRPKVTVRVAKLSRDAIEACARMFGERNRSWEAAPSANVIHLDAGGRHGTAAGLTATDHVPTAVEREGRDLTFIVPCALSEGLNRVSLPSAEFRDRRKVTPKIVVFRVDRSGTGTIMIPPEILQSVVPGARSVKIRFAGTGTEEEARPQTGT